MWLHERVIHSKSSTITGTNKVSMASSLSKKSSDLDKVYKHLTYYMVAMPSLVSATFECQKFKVKSSCKFGKE